MNSECKQDQFCRSNSISRKTNLGRDKVSPVRISVKKALLKKSCIKKTESRNKISIKAKTRDENHQYSRIKTYKVKLNKQSADINTEKENSAIYQARHKVTKSQGITEQINIKKQFYVACTQKQHPKNEEDNFSFKDIHFISTQTNPTELYRQLKIAKNKMNLKDFQDNIQTKLYRGESRPGLNWTWKGVHGKLEPIEDRISHNLN